jgi:hypothetical protein
MGQSFLNLDFFVLHSCCTSICVRSRRFYHEEGKDQTILLILKKFKLV